MIFRIILKTKGLAFLKWETLIKYVAWIGCTAYETIRLTGCLNWLFPVKFIALMIFLTDVGLMVVLSDLSVYARILMMLFNFQILHTFWSRIKRRFSDVFLVIFYILLFLLFFSDHCKMLNQNFSHKKPSFFRT